MSDERPIEEIIGWNCAASGRWHRPPCVGLLASADVWVPCDCPPAPTVDDLAAWLNGRVGYHWWDLHHDGDGWYVDFNYDTTAPPTFPTILAALDAAVRRVAAQ